MAAARAYDVLVIGAGPAGVMAAATVARQGATVAVLDESPAAGGQVYKATPAGIPSASPPSPEHLEGERLRALLRASGAVTLLAHQVWSVSPGFLVNAIGPGGSVALTAPRLVVATGTNERVMPFPGWTTPGVLGLAAATLLIKSQRMLPGRATLVAGCGPLLVAVAAGIVKAGGRVVAVVDIAGPGDWLRRLPALLSRPDLLARGIRWVGTLRAAGVPLFARHAVSAVLQEGGSLQATVHRVEANGAPVAGSERRLVADCIVVGNGLVPRNDISRVLRADHRYERALGGWVTATDACGRTSVDGLYVTGDGGGITGAAAAERHGELVGMSVLRDMGTLVKPVYARAAARAKRQLRRARRFGGAMGELMALRPAQVGAIPFDTIVCRCEDVTRAEIEAAIDDGAREVNQVKAWTRCGMGPCQGRTCGDVVGELVAQRVGSREAAGWFTGRLPLRPVSLAALTGDYAYADIPIPKAAPL
ncbi:MAG: NAD(P)/FAD-dependent oxidoreductase [Casimicrobiaceae bacterium]